MVVLDCSISMLQQVSLLGDSQVKRLQKTILSLDPNYKCDKNYAVGGLCSDTLKSVVRANLTNFYTTVFLLIGINDILKGFPISSVKRNIKTIVIMLSRSNRTILLSTLPPTLCMNNDVFCKIQELNVFIQSLETNKSVTIITLHKHFFPISSDNKNLFQLRKYNGTADNIHLSSKGHMLIIELLIQQI